MNEAGYGNASFPSDLYICEDVVQPPTVPLKFTVIDSTSSSILLTWMKPQYDGGDGNLSYKIEQKLDDSSWSLCNDNLLQVNKDQYRYWEYHSGCSQAENKNIF